MKYILFIFLVATNLIFAEPSQASEGNYTLDIEVITVKSEFSYYSRQVQKVKAVVSIEYPNSCFISINNQEDECYILSGAPDKAYIKRNIFYGLVNKLASTNSNTASRDPEKDVLLIQATNLMHARKGSQSESLYVSKFNKVIDDEAANSVKTISTVIR